MIRKHFILWTLAVLSALALTPGRGRAADTLPQGRQAGLAGETDYRLIVTPPYIIRYVEKGKDAEDALLTVDNLTAAQLSYQVSDDARGDGLDFVTVTPGNGVTGGSPKEHQVSFGTAGLQSETIYDAKITVSAPAAINPKVEVPVRVRVTRAIQALEPSGGESYLQNDWVRIHWIIGSPQITASNYQIWKGSQKVYEHDVPFYGVGDKEDWFKIPYDFAAGDDYQIKVFAVNNGTYSDVSDAPFSIKRPPVRVLAPNMFEQWEVGKQYELKWLIEPTSGIQKVRMDLFRMDTSTCPWTFTWVAGLASEVPCVAGVNTLSFTMPDVGANVGDNYILKIRDMANPGTFDLSDWMFSISDPVRVVTPNSGREVWLSGTQVPVAWRLTPGQSGRVRLELWDTQGRVTDLGTANDADGVSTTTVRVPAVANPGKFYRIKAINLDNTAQYDFSDNPFTVKESSVLVMAPNGGETWYTGMPTRVEWRMDAKIIGAYVSIELWRNGAKVQDINPKYYAATGANSLLLTCPAVPAGSGYSVRIASWLAPTVYADASDQTFTIKPQPVKVLAPNGGERYYLGQPMTIRWQASSADVGPWVTVELLKDSIKYLDIDTVSTSQYDRTLSFVVPAYLPTSPNYRLRVRSGNTYYYFDDSDGPFSINPNPIQVTTPLAGAAWQVGDKAEIHWLANPQAFGTTVRFELWRNGARVNTLATDNSGAAEKSIWVTVPEGSSGEGYTVRAYSTLSGVAMYGESARFNITEQPVRVLQPNSNLILAGGGTVDVRWKTNPAAAGTRVNLELWRPSGKIATLGSDADATGLHTIRVTLPQVATRTDYRVRVVSALKTYLWDECNEPLTIKTPPAVPQGLAAKSGGNQVALSWRANTEDTLVGYNVYRDTSPTGSFATRLNSTPLTLPGFVDTRVAAGTRYYYRITAVGQLGTESAKSGYVYATPGTITLVLRDVRADRGQRAMLHVYCPAVTGVLGNKLEIRINYNPALLTPVEVQRTTLTRNFPCQMTAANGVLVITANTTPNQTLVGDGRLYDVVFQVAANAASGQTGRFSFAGAKLYGGLGEALAVNIASTATFTVASTYIMGDVTGDGKVTYEDVTRLSMALRGMVLLTTLQAQAADVSGDGVVNSADLQLVMLLSQGRPINPVIAKPAEAAGETTPALAGADLATGTTYNVTVASASGSTSDTVTIPLTLNPSKDIDMMSFMVNFDPHVLSYSGFTTTSLTGEFMPLVSQPTSGQVMIQLISANGIAANSGDVLKLSFKIRGATGQTSALSIAECSLYKGIGEDVSWTGQIVTRNGTVSVVRKNAVGMRWWSYE